MHHRIIESPSLTSQKLLIPHFHKLSPTNFNGNFQSWFNIIDINRVPLKSTQKYASDKGLQKLLCFRACVDRK